ncbi:FORMYLTETRAHYDROFOLATE DEFORMYLASE 1 MITOCHONDRIAL-LIKE [Salix purpurea]|uniref:FORMYLTETRAHYDROFOLATE DEFORMYLASE 1 MITOCHONDRIAL-LIKE n=1 Tax=Salix purpurea TaxID=77065 RepID=A0A9Q0THQ7_SALPP|nr:FORMYLTETRAHYDROFOLATE DEFORMYLASE 1 MITOCHONDRIAL-LIKE [Salix purpurea]
MNLRQRRVPQVFGFGRRSSSSSSRSFKSIDPSSVTHGIHVFQCPDAVGILAKLSDCIASRGGNILGADVFVPENKSVFYSRSEFIFDPVKWPRLQMDEDFLRISRMFDATRSVVRVPKLDPKFKIAVLASKQEHCLIDLLHSWQDGRLPVDITRVIRNGIPYHYLHTTNENKREDEILDLVQNTDFLVLARYMQLISSKFSAEI